MSDDLDELIQTSLRRSSSEEFTLSIYFGRNLGERYDRLSLHLFNLFQAPMLRAQFVRDRRSGSCGTSPRSPPAKFPESHRPSWCRWPPNISPAGGGASASAATPRYDLAILINPSEPERPLERKGDLKRSIKAAEAVGLDAELITRDDYGRLAEFDALFIRETTAVNHHTYRFARRAASEGLVVIDDPESIVRCTNKVYLAELLNRHKIPTPADDASCTATTSSEIASELGFPVRAQEARQRVLAGRGEGREPAGAAEHGRAASSTSRSWSWRRSSCPRRSTGGSASSIAGRCTPASTTWPPSTGRSSSATAPANGRYGKSETLPVELAPRQAVRAALKAANLIGDGLYGVDVKQIGRQVLRDRGQRQPQHRRRRRGPRAARRALPPHHGRHSCDRIEQRKAGIARTMIAASARPLSLVRRLRRSSSST